MMRNVACCLVATIALAVAHPQALSPERFRNRTALWQRSGKNILSGFRNTYNFQVLYEPGAEYLFRAWFFGWAVEDCNSNIPGFKGCDALFAARAKRLEGPWEVYARRWQMGCNRHPPACGDRCLRHWTPYGVAMGYAKNRGDFLKPGDRQVVCAGKEPCLWEFPNPDVVRVGSVYYAYAGPSGYANHTRTGRKVVEAVSRDGLNWQVLGYMEPEADAPAIHVPKALVLREEGKTFIYLFYVCQTGGEPEYDYRYNRIRFMRREAGEK